MLVIAWSVCGDGTCVWHASVWFAHHLSHVITAHHHAEGANDYMGAPDHQDHGSHRTSSRHHTDRLILSKSSVHFTDTQPSFNDWPKYQPTAQCMYGLAHFMAPWFLNIRGWHLAGKTQDQCLAMQQGPWQAACSGAQQCAAEQHPHPCPQTTPDNMTADFFFQQISIFTTIAAPLGGITCHRQLGCTLDSHVRNVHWYILADLRKTSKRENKEHRREHMFTLLWLLLDAEKNLETASIVAKQMCQLLLK